MRWGPNRDGKWWLKRTLGVFGGIYTLAQAFGAPQNLFVWWRCHRGTPKDCDQFLEAARELSDLGLASFTSLDPWRVFNICLFLVCVALLLPDSVWRRRRRVRGATVDVTHLTNKRGHFNESVIDKAVAEMEQHKPLVPRPPIEKRPREPERSEVHAFGTWAPPAPRKKSVSAMSNSTTSGFAGH